jgi:ATP-dependent DNA helicase
MPSVFDSIDTFQSWFGTISNDKLQDNKVIENLHNILKPFLLRRVKSEVEVEIPDKKEFVVYCPMTKKQVDLYRATVSGLLREHLVGDEGKQDEKGVAVEEEESGDGRRRSRRSASTKRKYEEVEEFEGNDDEFLSALHANQETAKENFIPVLEAKTRVVGSMSLQNVIMQARKVCNHPILFENEETDFEFDDVLHEKVDDYQTIVKDSGKMLVLGTHILLAYSLEHLLPKLFSANHKVLIFSQFTKTLDLIQSYAEYVKHYPICRIDGSTSLNERQTQIKKFHTPSHNLFLLSTRAGGLGINLVVADTVIIFDSDWNPQMDLQAQDRVHRIGQTKTVHVYRFIKLLILDS